MLHAGCVPTPRAFSGLAQMSPRPFPRWRGNTIRASRGCRRADPTAANGRMVRALRKRLVSVFFRSRRSTTPLAVFSLRANHLPATAPIFPTDAPPEIPQERPGTSAERTRYLRAAASWLVRHGDLRVRIYTGTMNNVEWLKDYHDLVQAARDEPEPLEELQAGVGLKRPGDDDHHIVEQTWAEQFGFSRGKIDDPSNLVSIPRWTHYQITGWYAAKTDEYGGLSPREYLRDKSWDVRRQVGLDALARFKVSKP